MIHRFRLKDGSVHAVQIMRTTFKKLKVWLVQFKDGKQAMLYKCGNEWLQRIEDFLDASLIRTIGSYIDSIAGKDHPTLKG